MVKPADSVKGARKREQEIRKEIDNRLGEIKKNQAISENNSESSDKRATAAKKVIILQTEVGELESQLREAEDAEFDEESKELHGEEARLAAERKQIEEELEYSHQERRKLDSAGKELGRVKGNNATKVKSHIRKIGRGIRMGASASTWVISSMATFEGFFILTIVVWLFEMFVFQFGGNRLSPLILGVYGLLVLAGTMSYGLDQYTPKRFLVFSSIAAIYVIGIPFLLELTGSPPMIQSAIFILPLWVFIAWKMAPDDHWTRWLSGLIVKGIMLILLVVALFLMMTSWGDEARFDTDFNVRTAFDFIWQPFKQGIEFLFGGFWDALVLAFKSAFGIFTDIYDQARYFGQVEENREAPLGVYVTNFRSLDNYLESGSPIYLSANIESASFINEFEITSRCYAVPSDNEDRLIEGRISPEYPLEVEGRMREVIDCIFNEDDSAKLWAETYDITLESSFGFETWGYVEYQFMDSDVIRGYARQSIDVNTELGIPSSSSPIFTNGPIMIGFYDPPLPVSINLEKADEWSMPLGVTVENRWRGEVLAVKDYILRLPNEFEIVGGSCNRGAPTELEDDEAGLEGYTSYKFKNPDADNLNYNPKDFYSKWDTLQCRIKLSDGEATALSLLNANPKAVRSFAVQVSYDYKLKKTLGITVMGDPEPVQIDLPGPNGTTTTPTASVYNIVGRAVNEFEYFDGKDECDPDVESRMNSYYQAGRCGVSDCDNTPWSAAFTSYVMTSAGVGGFPAACGHTTYFSSIRDNPGACRAFDMSQYQNIKPGDLVCKCRTADCPTYNTASTQPSHCDVVVEVKTGEWVVIGGNLDDTVKKYSVKGNDFVDNDYFGFISCT